MELGDYKIVASYWNGDQQPHPPQNPNTWSTTPVNRVGDSFLGYPNVIKLKKGFYKLNIEYIDQRTDVDLDIQIRKHKNPIYTDADYKNIGSQGSGTHLFSNSYIKALEDKGYVSSADANGYRKALNGYGNDPDDFNRVMHLKHNTNTLEGSNLNDVFIYNGKSIDAKGGVDKLIFVEDTKLEEVSNLNDTLKSFERLQLGTETQAVSISLNTKNVLDIIDSKETTITIGSGSGRKKIQDTQSMNTVLKISGDDEDGVKLISDGNNKFELATDKEVTMLNWKHSQAIGDEFNKVEVTADSGSKTCPDHKNVTNDASGNTTIHKPDHAVNHVYKGTYTDGTSTKTFFVEIDKNIKITNEGDDQNNTFTYEGNKIDAKGGVDTLIFTENIDLSRVDDLNDKLKSFEILQLGSNSTQAVSIGLDAKSVLDIIDAQVTDGGLKSVNTVLKIKGDNNDKVALDGKGTIFTQATDSEVAALNLKHSASGDTHNQVAIDGSGHALNQVYKGIYGSGASAQTFFIEIDKDVSVVNLVH